ncbi:MAG: hypothetical protein K6360_03310 [Deltaproteobacteria bacterium]
MKITPEIASLLAKKGTSSPAGEAPKTSAQNFVAFFEKALASEGPFPYKGCSEPSPLLVPPSETDAPPQTSAQHLVHFFRNALAYESASLAPAPPSPDPDTAESSGLSPTQTASLAVLDRTLSLLDRIEGLLIDQNKTSSSDLVSAIREGVEDLRELRDRLDPADPLREQMDAIGALAYTESEKVTRGDYDT